MKRNLLKTDDGSYTLQIPEWNEQYHSKHGAVAEAQHVFIQAGLQFFLSVSSQTKISILEIGFGTGLNCLLTLLESDTKSIQIKYTGIEAYPLGIDEIQTLNFSSILNSSDESFLALHDAPWEEPFTISENFQLIKQQKFFDQIEDIQEYDIIYFDAFGIRVQPDLWTEKIFKKMHAALRPGGILVTYAANGNARRAMMAVGFEVERLTGPPGKKEMMRAIKTVLT